MRRKWLLRAAVQGDAEAQRDLGYAYHEGKGVRRDYSRAIFWYRKAARQGDTKAQFNIGLSYLAGDGVPQNKGRALTWLRKAAKRHHRAAREKIHELTQCGAA